MKSLFSTALFVVLLTSVGYTQISQVNHWESPVLGNDTFKYWIGTTEPNANWRSNSFNDSGWLEGPGGIGFSDGDDSTVIPSCGSVMLRKTFQVPQSSSVAWAYFHMDYDDGFVAYLNGVEIARSNMADNISFPAASEFATVSHEAVLYSGGTPESYSISLSQLQSILVDGQNTLAVQVHNRDATSSDLSAIPFLTFGISTTQQWFAPPPSWFNYPIGLDSSHLPIIVINTFGQTVQDEPAIMAGMGVIDNGAGNFNHTDDPFNGYSGFVEFEWRGESSLMFDKKSFRVETKDPFGQSIDVSLLGLPSDNDWIFYGPYSDKSLIRNAVTFELGRKMGHYASRTRFFELMIDDDYQGVYVLMEKIKRGNDRLDIANLKTQDTLGEESTGGYILRVDKIEPDGSPGFFSNPNPPYPNYNPHYFQFFQPKEADLHPNQIQYISSFIEQAESALSTQYFLQPGVGYKEYFDLPSFADFQIINELTKNVDAYRYSTYFYKDKNSRNSKLQAGPLWDFNLGFGNVDYWDNCFDIPGWMYTEYRMWWFARMMEDGVYIQNIQCRWQELRQTSFSNDSILYLIDSLTNHLGPAIDRNFNRWPILGQYVWPNKYVAPTYLDEIDFVKNWIIDRATWMDEQWDLECNLSAEAIAENASGILVFPNPTSSHITINLPEMPSGTVWLELYTVDGKLVMREQTTYSAKTLDLSNVAKGVYVLKLNINNAQHFKKIIVE